MARKRGRAAPTKRRWLPRTRAAGGAPAATPLPAQAFDLAAGERRKVAADSVEHHEREYHDRAWVDLDSSVDGNGQHAGNPLHVWRAYLECRGHGLPIPGWILAYLDRVAGRLWQLTADGSRTPEDPSPVIAESLEMKRPGRSGQCVSPLRPDRRRWSATWLSPGGSLRTRAP